MTPAERIAMYRANCKTCLLSDRMKPCKNGEYCLFEQPEVRESVEALTAAAYMNAPDPEPWQGRRVIVTAGFAERWTTDPAHYRDHFGAADVEVRR